MAYFPARISESTRVHKHSPQCQSFSSLVLDIGLLHPVLWPSFTQFSCRLPVISSFQQTCTTCPNLLAFCQFFAIVFCFFGFSPRGGECVLCTGSCLCQQVVLTAVASDHSSHYLCKQLLLVRLLTRIEMPTSSDS